MRGAGGGCAGRGRVRPTLRFVVSQAWDRAQRTNAAAARSTAIVRLARMLNRPGVPFAPPNPNSRTVRRARARRRRAAARRSCKRGGGVRYEDRAERRFWRTIPRVHTAECVRDRSHAARTGRRWARTRDRPRTTAPERTKQKIAHVLVVAEVDAHLAIALLADELRVDAAHRLAGAGVVVLEKSRERNLHETDPRSERNAGQTCTTDDASKRSIWRFF